MASPDLIRRRLVFYIAGYDPQGVAGYHGIFRRELARFAKVWSVKTNLGAPQIDADGIAARWTIEASGPDWQVSTAYEFLRWDDIVAGDMTRPMRQRVPRAIGLYLRNAFNGVIARLFGANWRFAVFYLYPIIALLALALLPVCLGWLAARGAFATLPSVPVAIVVGVLVLAAGYWLGGKLADKWYAFHLADAWLWIDDWVKGRKDDFTDRIDLLAARIVAGARASDVDEIVVIGHSGGAAFCVAIMARALALDPDLARRAPCFSVMALGTLIPLPCFYPEGGRARADVRRLATAPGLLYVDCQARNDIMNIYGCDPAEAIGVAAAERRDVITWKLRFRDMLAPEFYARLRWNYFRMHFQFIMAADRRAPYEYFMFVCGPAPVAAWAKPGAEMIGAFGPDGSFAYSGAAPAPREA